MVPRHLKITMAVLAIAVAGLSIYVFRLKGLAEENVRRTSDTRPVTPPQVGPSERVRLIIAYDEDVALRAREVEVPLPAEQAERARELLRALIMEYAHKPSPHPLAEGADVREVFLVPVPGGYMAVVDVNAAFADGHRSGVLVEDLTLASVIETLAANVAGVLKVKLLVNGAERETLAGHSDLTGFYEVSAVREAHHDRTIE